MGRVMRSIVLATALAAIILSYHASAARKRDPRWSVGIEDCRCGFLTVAPSGWLYLPLYRTRGDVNLEAKGEDSLLAVAPDGHVKWRLTQPDAVFSRTAIGPDGSVFTIE